MYSWFHQKLIHTHVLTDPLRGAVGCCHVDGKFTVPKYAFHPVPIQPRGTLLTLKLVLEVCQVQGDIPY